MDISNLIRAYSEYKSFAEDKAVKPPTYMADSQIRKLEGKT